MSLLCRVLGAGDSLTLFSLNWSCPTRVSHARHTGRLHIRSFIRISPNQLRREHRTGNTNFPTLKPDHLMRILKKEANYTMLIYIPCIHILDPPKPRQILQRRGGLD